MSLDWQRPCICCIYCNVFGYWRRRSDCYFVLLTTSLVVTTITFTLRHELVRLCSQLPRWQLALAHCLLLLQCWNLSLIVELRELVLEHLVQGFSFVSNSALASVASESNNSVSARCSGNVFSFLVNMLILFLVIGCSSKKLLEPLRGNGRLCFFRGQYFCF
jgi:hypothetical protein